VCVYRYELLRIRDFYATSRDIRDKTTNFKALVGATGKDKKRFARLLNAYPLKMTDKRNVDALKGILTAQKGSPNNLDKFKGTFKKVGMEFDEKEWQPTDK